ncbi:MAG TPA: glycine cleavage T C-terminal barrel domain-containing protein [Pyrinomonadaceae bacterium]
MNEAAETERDAHALPAHYGDARAEYDAVRGRRAGLIDLSAARGRVEVSGAEAVQFLNGMVTNDVKALEDGAWMHAAFPNVQGRLLASVRVIRRGGAYLFDTEAATHAVVLKNLERFTLAGDFRVRDASAGTGMISVQGAGSREVVRAVAGEEAAGLRRGRAAEWEWGGAQTLVLRATHTAEDGFDFVCDAGLAVNLWESLASAGARPVGFDALEVLRIEAGIPRYGVDVDDTNVVLEAALDEAVSFTKGCYVGQEIIARIHWRGHVAKRLAGLVLEDGDAPAAAGAKVFSSDGAREIGRVTSSVYSPRLGRAVALGVVKYDFLSAGTEVRVRDGDGGAGSERAARVAELPLVRGSWYDSAGDGAEDA